MADLNYDIINNEKEMQFEIELNGEKAYLTYRFYKKDIAFMHTFVPASFAGKGIASALAKAAFAYAEKSNKLVMVYCPFVGNFLKSHPEYNKQVDGQYK